MRMPLIWSHRLFFLMILVLAIMIAAWRFMPYVSSVFYGDDLFFYLSMKDGGYGAKVSDLFLSTYQERFRPIGFGYAMLLFNFFGASTYPHIAVNLLLNGLSALLVFFIVRRISDGHWLLAIMMSLAVASFRFSTVAITQVIAAEALSFLLFIGLMYSAVRTHENTKHSLLWGGLSVLLGFLLIHAHERYIVVFVWLFVFFLLSPSVRQLPQNSRLALLLSCLLIPIFNVAYKLTVLHTPFFVGTGGSYIGGNISRVFRHLYEAISSIFGFNIGPEYLVGVSITDLQDSYAWLFAFALVILWLFMLYGWVCKCISKSVVNKWEIAFFPLMLLFLGGLLLAPAISTIRLEQRWLTGSFVSIIIFFPAWISGRVNKVGRIPMWLLAFAITCAVVFLDRIYVKSFGNLYLARSADFVAAVKHSINDFKMERGQQLVFINTAKEHCSWSLAGGRFFEVYEDHPRALNCVTKIEDSFTLNVADNARIFLLVDNEGNKLKEITNEWRGLYRIYTSNLAYDFISNFQDGSLNNTAKVDTPSGKGVLLLPWESTIGNINTLTIVPNFSYRYQNIEIPNEAFFLAGVSMIYPSLNHARAVIEFNSKGLDAISASYHFDLPSPEADTQLRFHPILISLRQFEGKRVSIRFSIEESGGVLNSHWVGFAYPRIVTWP